MSNNQANDLPNDRNDPTILDLIKDVEQAKQSPEFKQQMYDRIQSRVAEEEQKRRTGLDFYLRKVLVAVPVIASLALVFTLAYMLSSPSGQPSNTTQLVKTQGQQFKQTGKTPPANDTENTDNNPITDPEIQEIIALAFAFEAESNGDATAASTIKTASSIKETIILTYLRE